MDEESNLVLSTAADLSAPITTSSPIFEDLVDLESLLKGVVEGFDENLQNIEVLNCFCMDSAVVELLAIG